jgi:hypothetical protein
MERHDMMKRAARYLLGAGTFAAAMLAMGTGQTSAATESCAGEAPALCGHVYTETDTTAPLDGFQVGEGTGDVTVVFVYTATGLPAPTTTGNNTSTTECADTSSSDCGYYFFDFSTPGDYSVCILVNNTNTGCKEVTGPFLDVPVGSENVPQDAEPPYEHYDQGQGTGTPGYWKNHPEAWPPAGVTVGGVLYQGPTIQTAIKLMGKVTGDKTYSMFSALIAAKLNTMASLDNDYSCVAGTIYNADLWMSAHAVGSGIKASSQEWRDAEDWHSKLDDYNNGKLCAHHRD